VVAALPLHGDAPALIEDARCGICVEPENPVEFSNAMRRMLADGRRADEYGACGREYAEKNLSLAVSALKYEELFSAVGTTALSNSTGSFKAHQHPSW